jgi:hypothetical protein
VRQSEIFKPLAYRYSWLELHIKSSHGYLQQALPICADNLLRDYIHRLDFSRQSLTKRLAHSVGSSDQNHLWLEPQNRNSFHIHYGIFARLRG